MNKFVFTLENERGKSRKHTIMASNIDSATRIFETSPSCRGWEIISIEEKHKRGGKPTWEEMSS